MRRSLGDVLLLAALSSFCGCSSEVSVPRGGDGDACTALPSVATSLEAVALARKCVPSADDALVFEYYGAWDEDAMAPQAKFAEWHFILSIDGVLNNVVFIGSSSTSPNGVIAAHELQPLNGSLPDCGAPGLTVVDSEARTDAAAELFSSLGVNVASAAVYHGASCIPWRWSPHFVVLFPQGPSCADCYRSVAFDDSGKILRVCWSTACLDGKQEYCCEEN